MGYVRTRSKCGPKVTRKVTDVAQAEADLKITRFRYTAAQPADAD